MQNYKLTAVSDSLKKYDIFAKDDSFIEVTEWKNGEGIMIYIDDEVYSFTYGQLDAINYLSDTLRYQNFDNENAE